jgi:ubiquinone/menaquinone biosynthesis C-methylase UbiE
VDALAELQHPQSRAFELVADLYERARPEYPADALAWMVAELDLHEGRTVLDLGAGTGKLTRALVPTGASVIAVEPGEQMLAQLRVAVPGVHAMLGAAEAIPLADGTVDAITIGQAFHWFRHEEALPELHRVLRRGGAIGLIWNTRDHDHPIQRDIRDLIAPLVRRRRKAHSVEELERSELFGPVEERQFGWTQSLTADDVVARVGSISFVAAATPEQRAELERQLREVVERAGGIVDFPYIARTYVTHAV